MTIGLGEVHDCIANPLKLRIIMLLARNGPMSAKRIQTETGAPQTSLYRALNGMQGDGIIEVASETRVRAVTERAYDLSIDFRHFDVDAVRNNDVHGYCSMFSSFSLGLIRDFQEYAEDENADLSRDSTGFASVGLYLTDEEAKMLSWRMVELIEPFHNNNYGYTMYKHQLDYWTPTHTDARWPILTSSVTSSASSNNNWNYGSDLFMFNASYLRLKDLQVGYTFPKKWMDKIGVEKLRLYFDAQNLFTISGVSFIDPEASEFGNSMNSGGANSGRSYPNLRYFGMGVDITF